MIQYPFSRSVSVTTEPGKSLGKNQCCSFAFRPVLEWKILLLLWHQTLYYKG